MLEASAELPVSDPESFFHVHYLFLRLFYILKIFPSERRHFCSNRSIGAEAAGIPKVPTASICLSLRSVIIEVSKFNLSIE